MPVFRIEQEMDCSEYDGWKLFLEIEPDSEDRDKYEHAFTRATIASTVAKRRVRIKEFILELTAGGKTMGIPEMKAKVNTAIANLRSARKVANTDKST